jgi:hypothetical protein
LQFLVVLMPQAANAAIIPTALVNQKIHFLRGT